MRAYHLALCLRCSNNGDSKDLPPTNPPREERVLRSRYMSDRFPLKGSFMIQSSDYRAWTWPKQTVLPDKKCAEFDWNCKPTSMTEWTAAATKWISDSFGVVIPSKLLLSVAKPKMRRLQPDHTYMCLLACQRSLQYMSSTQSSTPEAIAKLKRRFRD